MKGLYTLFWEPGNLGARFDAWEDCFMIGFYILLGVALLMSIIYYLVLGRISSRHSNNKKWGLFLLLTLVGVVGFSILVCGYGLLGNFGVDSWTFSLINGLVYSPFVFLIFSLIMNNFTIHSKYVPFRIFK